MTKLDLGPIGVALSYGAWEGPWDAMLGAAPELEAMGYATIWVSGGQLDDLGQIADLVRATRTVPVGTGIIPVDLFPSEVVAKAYAEIEATHPGRFIVGLGGAHGPSPLRTLGDYLDRLDSESPNVPATTRMLAALGPRMLELARNRTAGAFPLLMTPDATAQARATLGEDATLVVNHCVVVETDPLRARQAARGVVGPLSGVTGYARHLQRMGFTEGDVVQLSDRMVDALVAWGDVETIAGRVAEYLAAGADQVALIALPTDEPATAPVAQWRQLAEALVPERQG